MKIVVVGGIGAGKSTVIEKLQTEMLKMNTSIEPIKPSVTFCSVDKFVSWLYENSIEVKEFLKSLGIKDKAQMSDVVFENPFIKEKLESICAPLISKEINYWVDREDWKKNHLIVEFPLLFQYPEYLDKFDVIVSVTAPIDVRIGRIKNRNGFSTDKILSIINSQPLQQDVDERADVVIYNGSDKLDSDDINILLNDIGEAYFKKQASLEHTDKDESDLKIGIVSGSFDPITKGHMWLIDRALDMVDKVYIVIGTNPGKNSLFTQDEKKNMICDSLDSLPKHKLERVHIKVLPESELLVYYAKELGAAFIFRGLRSGIDFEYESQINMTQRKLNPDIEIVYLMPPRDKIEISSSFVKGLYKLNGTDELIQSYVPYPVYEALKKKLK